MKNTIKYILGIVVGVIGIASHAYAVNYPVYVWGGPYATRGNIHYFRQFALCCCRTANCYGGYICYLLRADKW